MVGRPSSLMGMVQLYQRKYLPAEPTSMEDLITPTEWTKTGDVEPRPFLIYNTGVAEERMVLIFASDDDDDPFIFS